MHSTHIHIPHQYLQKKLKMKSCDVKKVTIGAIGSVGNSKIEESLTDNVCKHCIDDLRL